MRRALVVAGAVYLCAALGTRLAEAAGLRHCHCSSACWCRTPGLSAFRWVLPVAHR